MILVFWVLSFKSAFSLSSFSFINNLRHADDKSEDELKSLLMKLNGESEKADLKLNTSTSFVYSNAS